MADIGQSNGIAPEESFDPWQQFIEQNLPASFKAGPRYSVEFFLALSDWAATWLQRYIVSGIDPSSLKPFDRTHVREQVRNSGEELDELGAYGPPFLNRTTVQAKRGYAA